MFKKLGLIFAVFTLVITLSSCGMDGFKKSSDFIIGEGEIEKREVDIKDFSSIDISRDFKVEVEKGEEFKGEIQTNKNIFQHLKVYVENGILHAQYKEDVVIKDTEIKLFITMPEIQNIDVKNDSIVDLKSEFKWDGESAVHVQNDGRLSGVFYAKDLKLNVENDGMVNITGKDEFKDSGEAAIYVQNDGKLSGELYVKKLELTAENDGRVGLKGQTEEISAKGGNDTQIIMGEFKVGRGTLTLDNGSVAEFTVEDSLDITLRGESVFKYKGDGKIKEVEVDEDAKVIKG